jgi:3-oxoacyl-[acyl-carrier protein] reductase
MSGKRVVVVTGAGRGIGRAIAVALAEPGADVVINYSSSADAAQEAASMVEARGAKPHLHRFDVSNAEEVKESFKQIVKELSRVDVLVNNAGITRDNLLALMKPSEWDDVLNVDLKGVFLCSQAVVKPMMKQKFGRIVNITSIVGAMGNAGQSNYAAAKAGVIGFTRSLARELVSRNITVNAVAPGYIETEMTHGMQEKAREALLTQIPAGRVGTPEEVAEAVKFFVSDAAGYVTGQVLHVNGGMFMG